MSIFSILLSLIILGVAGAVIFQNLGAVTFVFFGFEFTGPLASVLLLLFLAGFVVATLIFVPQVIKLGYQNRKMKREIDIQKKRIQNVGVETGIIMDD